MNPELKKFIGGIGILGEACAVSYKSCIAQDFEVGQPIELTKTFLTGIVTAADKRG